MNQFSSLLKSDRVLLYHKQATSAMTRFFMRPQEGVVVGDTLPGPACVLNHLPVPSQSVIAHPASIASELERWLKLESGSIEVNQEFSAQVEIPGSNIRIHLMRFTTIDPPFAEAEAVGAVFVPLTQTRGLPPVQMELLRLAYAVIMEG